MVLNHYSGHKIICDDKLVNRRYCGYTKLVYSAHRTVVGLAYSLADCNSTTAQLLIFLSSINDLTYDLALLR